MTVGNDVTVDRLDPAHDLDALVEVERECFTNPWTREMFAWELANSDVSHIFVLRAETERVAAFCSTWLVFDELHINNLGVRTTWRGRGLATHLLAFVLREAFRLGARRVTLEVRRSNGAALTLYTRFGFRTAGVRRQYYSNPPEDALILWLDPLAEPIPPLSSSSR
jgi:ribosomal-protein-alanine N-acetyltransferase